LLAPQHPLPHRFAALRSQHDAILQLPHPSLQQDAAVLSPFMQDFASFPPQQEVPSLPAQQEAMAFPSSLPWRMHAEWSSFAFVAILSQQAHFGFSVEVLSLGAEGVGWVDV